MARRMKGSALVKSRVARRLVGLFLLCALVPTAGLAAVAFHHVSEQLREQSRRWMHQSAKAAGLSVVERLGFLENELRVLATMPAHTRQAETWQALRERYRAVSRLSALKDGAVKTLFGQPLAPPPKGSRAEKQLAAGEPALWERLDGEGVRHFVLATTRGMGEPILMAEIEPGHLLGAIHDHAQGGGPVLCLLDSARVPLGCSEEYVDPARLRPRVGTGPAGAFEWTTAEGEVYSGYHWTVFLGARFAAPSWYAVVTLPRAEVVAPQLEFARWFLGVAAVAIGVVGVLSLVQIRRSLVPLRKLTRATERIAERRFDTKVDVNSGDEFEDLAVAFNSMTQRLARQFREMASRHELDRAVLTAVERGDVVDGILEHLPLAYDCESVSVTLLEPGGPARLHLAVPGAGIPPRSEEVKVAPIEQAQIFADPVGLDMHGADEFPPFLAAHAYCGSRFLRVLPVGDADAPIGILALGQCEVPPHDPGERMHARQLADQVAVALEKARMHEAVHFLAYHDSLTRLPNRLWVREAVGRAIPASDDDGTVAGLLFLDLDRFKRVNDTLGHTVGDELLCAVSTRLREVIDEIYKEFPEPCFDVELARLSGDEFTVLVSGARCAEEIEGVAERVHRALTQPFHLGGHELAATTSIGVALSPHDGTTVAALFKNADAALHDAKRHGRNRVRFYVHSMSQGTLARIGIEAHLRSAIENDGFHLVYQPILDVRSGAVSGAEALVRLKDPEFAQVGPADFIPVAEETGLIVPLGEQVMREACGAVRRWTDAGHADLRVSVNLSPVQFRGQKLVEAMTMILAETGARPRNLGLEITESTLLEAREESIDTLRRLRALGIRVSVDDFGTGYSSLAYLKNFPVDALKIDRSFVRDLGWSADDSAITRAIIALGRSLKLRVVAEGVETQEQFALLRDEGCDEIQGFLIGKPQDEEGFATSFLDDAVL